MARRTVNKVFLLGRVGKEREFKKITKGEGFMMTFSLATDFMTIGGSTGTDWHKVIAWGKTAQVCDQYMHSGQSVFVEGELKPSIYKVGKRWTKRVVVNARSIIFLSKETEGMNDMDMETGEEDAFYEGKDDPRLFKDPRDNEEEDPI